MDSNEKWVVRVIMRSKISTEHSYLRDKNGDVTKELASCLLLASKTQATTLARSAAKRWPSYLFKAFSREEAKLDEATRLVVKNLMDANHTELASTVLEFLEDSKLSEKSIVRIRKDLKI
jgi:hypothetical protein